MTELNDMLTKRTPSNSTLSNSRLSNSGLSNRMIATP